jgi:predicted hydrocarbon binding protein
MNDPYQTRQFFNMKHSELKQIIKEEIRKVLEVEDPSQTALDNIGRDLGVKGISGSSKNKFRTEPKEQEYEVGYWAYTNYGPEGMTTKVMATSEKDALEKAFNETRGKSNSYKVIAIDGKSK